ncbi:MAG: STAS domain-containing protein [Clostridiales bacterium]|nr:STAS domain-containing protein [Clostridiales bacterium]
MKIIETQEGNRLVLILKGRLDAVTSPELERALLTCFDTWKEEGWEGLELSCTDLEYVSSAGLRVFLTAQKAAMKKKCEFCLTGVRPFVMEVLQMTGFTRILDIREVEE